MSYCEANAIVGRVEYGVEALKERVSVVEIQPRATRLVSSMGRADLLWPRVDLDLTRKVRSNTGRVNVDQRWARLEAGRGGDSFDPL